VKSRYTGAGIESRYKRDFAKLSTPEAHKPADLARNPAKRNKKADSDCFTICLFFWYARQDSNAPEAHKPAAYGFED
jgi:hypothetical protein